MNSPVFELSNQEAKLVSFSPRRELHGDDPQPAADLRLFMNLDAAELVMFDPTLRSLLFHKAEHAASNLADQAHDAPDLRFPKLKGPLDWDLEIIGAELTLHRGLGGKSDLTIPSCTVNKFQLDPQQGGRVLVGFRVQAHPSESQSGKLAFLIGEDVEISLAPPEAETPALPAADPKKPTTKRSRREQAEDAFTP